MGTNGRPNKICDGRGIEILEIKIATVGQAIDAGISKFLHRDFVEKGIAERDGFALLRDVVLITAKGRNGDRTLGHYKTQSFINFCIGILFN